MELLTANFSVKEMQCPCGCELCDMDVLFLDKLQALRDDIKRPLHITSGYRCPPHNLEVKGVKTSRHLIGIAADISTWGMTSSCLYLFLRTALGIGFTGVGVGKNFVHVDTRKSKGKLWVY